MLRPLICLQLPQAKTAYFRLHIQDSHFTLSSFGLGFLSLDGPARQILKRPGRKSPATCSALVTSMFFSAIPRRAITFVSVLALFSHIRNCLVTGWLFFVFCIACFLVLVSCLFQDPPLWAPRRAPGKLHCDLTSSLPAIAAFCDQFPLTFKIV